MKKILSLSIIFFIAQILFFMANRITHLKLKNFKCFQDLDIDLKPLTILTGANSSGKSSIIYSILVALQSKDFPYFFSANGKYVNLGNYKNMVYRHETERDITIELTIDDLQIQTVWQQNEVKKMPDLKCLKMKKIDAKIEVRKKEEYHLNFEGKQFWNIEEKLLINKTFENLNEVINEVSSEWSTYFLVELPYLLLRKVNFISSFRLYPERTYYEKSQSSYSVSKFGEGYTDQIIDWQSENKEVFADLIKIMKSLDLFHDIQAKRIEGGRFELLVKPKANSVFSSLNDVGFGISQFLPIVTADLQLGDGSTLFVAQPEIHLHPNIQAKFANYVTQQIYEKENNYVVETHSEYFLNRVRLLLVEGTLKAEDVAIYYLENDGQDVTVHQLEFTTKGEILNAPEGFFDTYMMDVMDIAFKA